MDTYAVLVVALVYWCARLPSLSLQEHDALAGQFRFVRFTLPEVAGPAKRSVRPVHPDVKHIASWISAVGAACSLADLDGDGLANDVCYVDTRTNQVIVAPVPGTRARYAPFVLDPSPLPTNRDTTAPNGCLPGDLNEDGLLDVVVFFWGRTPIAFLRRLESGNGSSVLDRSRYIAREIVPTGERWFTNTATRADVDGDGHVDVVVGNYFQDDANLLDTSSTDTQQMHHAMSAATNGGRNRLLLWNGATSGASPTVRFKDVRDVWEDDVACAWTLAIGAADLDGDMLPEIYCANDFGHDHLFHNRSTPGRPRLALLSGTKRLTTPNSKVLGRDSFKGMGVDFGDLNGDGHLDIYVSNIAEEFALEESHFAFVNTGQPARMRDGIAPFVERSEALGLSRSGWSWESRLADFNNDGVLEAVQATGFVKGRRNRWPRLHEAAMGNDLLLRYPINWHRVLPGDDLSGHDPNAFFVRASDGRYYDLAPAVGFDDPQVSRGIATADVDGDGDLDFVVANQWEPSRYYRNDCPRPGSFLGLRLLLPTAGRARPRTEVIHGHTAMNVPCRPAIGAAATVHLPSGRILVGQVDGGNGHSGTRSPDLHFGLGDFPNESRVVVDVRWRDADGQIGSIELRLSPGWHTVLLSDTDLVDIVESTNDASARKG